MARAVVTGGAGFIGSHLVDALLERGCDVLVIDNLVTGRLSNLSKAVREAASRLVFIEKDICDPETAGEIESYKPDVVFHLAAQMDVRRSVVEPAYDATTNVVGTVALLHAAVRAGVRRFVFASTGGAIYGEQEYFPADEEHRVDPECPYGVSKRAAELYLNYFSGHSELRAVALRFANVYGPRQNPKGEAGVVAIFGERLGRGEDLVIYGDGKQTRDFVYVGDVVRANLTVWQREPKKHFMIFNVGTGLETSVLELSSMMKRVWLEKKGADSPGGMSSIVHAPARPGEQMRSVITSRALEQAFSWTPQVSLESGLAETISSF